MANQQDIERWIVNKIIREVHDGSHRISDSGQRDLHLVVRERIPSPAESGKIEIDKEELAALIKKFADQLRENPPEQLSPDTRTVIRRSLIGRILGIFSDVWPFGG